MRTKIAIFLLLCTSFFQISCDDCTPVTLDGFSKDQLSYWIQIGAFTEEKPEGDPFFEDAMNMDTTSLVLREIINNETVMYRYSIGSFKDVDTADDMQEAFLNSYPDAFVVAYGQSNPEEDDYTRISLSREEIIDVLANGCD